MMRHARTTSHAQALVAPCPNRQVQTQVYYAVSQSAQAVTHPPVAHIPHAPVSRAQAVRLPNAEYRELEYSHAQQKSVMNALNTDNTTNKHYLIV